MKVTALIDCNNFFASCERLFRPDLEGKPVVVLSSNDGCVVARSNESKALGIPMGAPYFKTKDTLEKHNVHVFSSNFMLYRDISSRVMGMLARYSDNVHVYSVDEAFIELTADSEEALLEQARQIRDEVKRWTGIPVTVGMSSTKVLAKIAASIGKKGDGVCFLDPECRDTANHLKSLDVGEVWGIGPGVSRKCRQAGVGTVWEFRESPDTWIKGAIGVGGLRIAHELRGIPRLSIREKGREKKSIRSSRSFGSDVTSRDVLKEAVAYHIVEATREMRAQGSLARFISVFLGVRRTGSRRTITRSRDLSVPEGTTPLLLDTAHTLVDELFHAGSRYTRAGVVVGKFIPEHAVPAQSLFGDEHGKERTITTILDNLTKRFGVRSLSLASVQKEHAWSPKKQKKSPSYTSVWREIREVSS